MKSPFGGFRKKDRSAAPDKPTAQAIAAAATAEENSGVIDAAKAMFQDEKFKQYWKAYEKMAGLTLDKIFTIDSEETDPAKYMARMKEVVTTARILGRMGFYINNISMVRADVVKDGVK